jgi:hypothetical protein
MLWSCLGFSGFRRNEITHKALKDSDFQRFSVDMSSRIISVRWSQILYELKKTKTSKIKFVKFDGGDITLATDLSPFLSVVVSKFRTAEATVMLFGSGKAPVMFPPATNSGYVRILRSIAKEAMQEALLRAREADETLSRFDVQRAFQDREPQELTQALQQDESFKNEAGALRFGISKANKIELRPQEQDDAQAKRFRALVERDIKRIVESNVIERLSNTSLSLSSLLQEYVETFRCLQDDHSSPDPIMLWRIGQDIQEMFGIGTESAARSAEYGFSDDIRFAVSSLLLSHNLYIVTYGDIASIVENLDKTISLYRTIEETRREGVASIGESLRTEPEILDESAIEAAQIIFPGQHVPVDERKGRIAMAFSFVRGVLREMGNISAQFYQNLGDAAAGSVIFASANQIPTAINIYEKIRMFTTANSETLLRLAEDFPVYFGWLKLLVRLNGML